MRKKSRKELTIERNEKKLKQSKDVFLKSIKEDISNIEKENDIFCGVVLTKKDLLNIISLMIDTKESVRIPFNIYFKA